MQHKLSIQFLFRLISLALFQLSLIQILSNLVPQLLQGSFIDYQVYQEASYHFLRGEEVYQQSVLGLPFLYPPPALVFLSLFVLLAGTQSVWLFTFCSLLALLASIWLLLDIALSKEVRIYPLLREVIERDKLAACFFVSAFALQTFPVKLTLANGQINHFVLLLITLSLFASVKQRNRVAVLTLAAAVLLKVYPVVLVLALFIKKQWNSLLQLAVAATVGLFIFGRYTLQFFSEVVLLKASTTVEFLPTAADQSLWAVAARLGLPSVLTIAVIGTVCLVAITQLTKHRHNSLVQLQLLSLPLLLVLAQPTWSHHLVLLYPWLLLLSPLGLALMWSVLALPLPVSETQSLFLYLRASLAPVVLFVFYWRTLHRK